MVVSGVVHGLMGIGPIQTSLVWHMAARERIAPQSSLANTRRYIDENAMVVLDHIFHHTFRLFIHTPSRQQQYVHARDLAAAYAISRAVCLEGACLDCVEEA